MALVSRPSALVSVLALMIAACGNATGDDKTPTPPEAAVPAVLGHVKGVEDAPLTVIEYASPTCSHCKHFHDDVMPMVEEKFISTGKVKFVFREYPLNDIDVVAYALANCAGDDRFFDVLDDLFEHQDDVFEASKDGTLEALFQDIAGRHGIAGKEAFNACLGNRPIRQRIADTMMTGDSFGVRATPTFIVNGQVKAADGDAQSADAFEAYLNGELDKLPQ
ncbi:thioredoxin domain-containing protein [Hyphomonas sp.]|uniref:thioredoxin domain-containing protein n=1 Tax=Hyphomonas sp. TaxID=87 RepID=UPI003D283C4F